MQRHEYELYFLYKECIPEKAHDFLIKCRKRDKIENPNRSNRTIIRFCYSDDSWVEKTVYPYEFTPEEVEEYVDENWMHIYSMYDCTGRTFTRDIRCFPICGKTIVYHFKAIDV